MISARNTSALEPADEQFAEMSINSIPGDHNPLFAILTISVKQSAIEK